MFDISNYLKYVVEQKLYRDFNWLTDMFTILEDNYEDDYIKVSDDGKSISVKQNDELIETGVKYGEQPLFTPRQEIILLPNTLANQPDKIKTTFGRFVSNLILLAHNFGNKIPYINNKFDISYIEKNYIIPKLISDSDIDKVKDGITIEEYTKFIDSVVFLTKINRYIVHSGTEKNMRAPDGIKEYRTKLIAEYKKKYGDDVMTKMDKVAEIEKKLVEYQREFLKDDPTLGKIIKGKVEDATKKMYLTYGHGGDFFFDDGKAHVIEKALMEGWNKDDKELTILFNDVRAAFFKRGGETQKGGYAAKQGLRATNDIKIIDTDCNTSVTLPFEVTKDTYKKIIGRYIKNGNNLILLENEEVAKSYIGKTVNLRSPMFCHIEKNFCKVCAGENMKNYPNAVAILVIIMAGIILNSSMKAMYAGSIEVIKFDLNDL